MLAVGEYIENFEFPACNKFRPTFLDGEFCYQLDVKIIQNISATEQPSIVFLLDQNEDRQYNKLYGNGDIHQTKPGTLEHMAENSAKQNEAMIYIETLGKSFTTHPFRSPNNSKLQCNLVYTSSQGHFVTRFAWGFCGLVDKVACIQTIITVLVWRPSNVMWHGKKHFELFTSDENRFYAWRDKKK